MFPDWFLIICFVCFSVVVIVGALTMVFALLSLVSDLVVDIHMNFVCCRDRSRRYGSGEVIDDE